MKNFIKYFTLFSLIVGYSEATLGQVRSSRIGIKYSNIVSNGVSELNTSQNMILTAPNLGLMYDYKNENYSMQIGLSHLILGFGFDIEFTNKNGESLGQGKVRVPISTLMNDYKFKYHYIHNDKITFSQALGLMVGGIYRYSYSFNQSADLSYTENDFNPFIGASTGIEFEYMVSELIGVCFSLSYNQQLNKFHHYRLYYLMSGIALFYNLSNSKVKNR